MSESGSGIGFFGVLLAVLVAFAVRVSAIDVYQDNVNDFCSQKGFSYGSETVDDTEIGCFTEQRKNESYYSYSEFENWMEAQEEQDSPGSGRDE